MAEYKLQDEVNFDFSGLRFAVVVSAYHQQITGNLRAAAVQTLTGHGVDPERIDILQVPGAWELALGCQVVARQQRYAGIVALGAVIRGETTHDQHINRFVSQALGELSLQHNLPLGFGLLTCDDLAQAEARSGGAVGNKGEEAAAAVLHMVALLDSPGSMDQTRERQP